MLMHLNRFAFASVAAIFLVGCTNSAVEADRSFYESLLRDNLKLGMTASQVANFFIEFQPDFDFYNSCTKSREKAPPNCEQGFTAMGLVALPSNNIVLGEGQAQVYLTFNSQQVLTQSAVEVYYANWQK